jgi:hypothetical protein
LITGLVVAAAFRLVPAAPAFAIHDPDGPARDCAAPNSPAVGHPAAAPAAVNLPETVAHSNAVTAEHNKASAPCAKAP